jgi:hypothetical protein
MVVTVADGTDDDDDDNADTDADTIATAMDAAANKRQWWLPECIPKKMASVRSQVRWPNRLAFVLDFRSSAHCCLMECMLECSAGSAVQQ